MPLGEAQPRIKQWDGINYKSGDVHKRNSRRIRDEVEESKFQNKGGLIGYEKASW